MSSPLPPDKHRGVNFPKKKPVVDEDAELKQEAYGDRGARLRRTAAGIGRSQAKASPDTIDVETKGSKPVVASPKGPIDRVTNWIGRQVDRLRKPKKSRPLR